MISIIALGSPLLYFAYMYNDIKKENNNIPLRFISLLPVLGMFAFVVLYVVAASKYTGGSYKIPSATQFDFWHNYLCDLLDSDTYNGSLNVSKYYARAALAVLCLSIMMVWYFVPLIFKLPKINKLLIQSSGILSMITALFLSSTGHDLIVRIAGILGFIALVSLLKALIDYKYYRLALGGAFCLLILSLNYIIYESEFQELPYR